LKSIPILAFQYYAVPFYDVTGLPVWGWSPVPTRIDLKTLAKLRLQEAEHLYKEGLYDGCVYLCGYVVEFALKARICKVLGLSDYPEDLKGFKTHNFDELKVIAGLKEIITIAKNTALFNNWSTATKWKPEQRYLPLGTFSAKDARDVLSSIEDKPDGVLTWLSKRW
jgi:HEPN domain-containing protein